ncbi:MAG: hypothetical protein H6811_02445 [Phycisphaeraceae bacterium]|nr:hypothetical protein [Phycisphaeraceae bacterium]
MTRRIVGLSLCLFLVTPAIGVAPQPIDEIPADRLVQPREINAALLYYRAWMVGDTFFREFGEREDVYGDAGWRPPEDVRTFLSDNEDSIGSILEAAAQPQADFGIEYDKGFMALLPHLGKLRMTARVLATDSRRLIASGDGDGSAERIAGIYGIASHNRSDRVLISTLVSMAVSSLAHQELDELLASELLTENGRQEILAMMDRFGEDDPFGAELALRMEQQLIPAWIARTYAGPTAGLQIMKSGLLSIVDQPATGLSKLGIAAMSDVAIAADLEGYTRYFEDVLKNWGRPDADELLQASAQLAESGHYGVFSRLLCPALTGAHRSDMKARAALEAARDRLEAADVVEPPAENP